MKAYFENTYPRYYNLLLFWGGQAIIALMLVGIIEEIERFALLALAMVFAGGGGLQRDMPRLQRAMKLIAVFLMIAWLVLLVR